MKNTLYMYSDSGLIDYMYLLCLQCKCCGGESTQVCNTMPDTCVAYKLHLECGQLINLYDWMQVIELDMLAFL